MIEQECHPRNTSDGSRQGNYYIIESPFGTVTILTVTCPYSKCLQSLDNVFLTLIAFWQFIRSDIESTLLLHRREVVPSSYFTVLN